MFHFRNNVKDLEMYVIVGSQETKFIDFVAFRQFLQLSTLIAFATVMTCVCMRGGGKGKQ